MSGVPTLVIGGYLGAGKTTLVNHMLRHADGQRIAVLVNDFGELNIDADLIVGQAGAIMELSGGCVCCSFGADLVGSLVALLQREPPPDLLLIETSGVALPAAVARTARLAQGAAQAGVLVVLDGETCQTLASDRYVADTVLQQIRDADLLLLNKTDLLDAAALDTARQWLAALVPRTPVLVGPCTDLPSGFWQGLSLARPAGASWLLQGRAMGQNMQPALHAADQFESRSWRLRPGVNVQALAAELECLPGLLRAKGCLIDTQDQVWVLQKVGLRTQLSLLGLQDEPSLGGLVIIGLKGQLPASLDALSGNDFT